MAGFPFRRRNSFPGGIHPAYAKAATVDKPIRRFPFAPFLVLLLAQHAGKPSRPIVRDGQEVARGQPVAEADGFMSVPIHAPASGIVRKVGPALDSSGKMSPAIVIEPFPGSDQQVTWGSPVDVDGLEPREIVQAIQDMGMVGLGGAAFPAHVKFSPPADKPIHTLIVNGCECEPYLTADHRVMVEQPERILLGTRLVQKALGAERSIIAIESNKPDAVAALRAQVERDGGPGDGGPGDGGPAVVVLETKYPQGAEKMLTQALLNLEIPSAGLPADIGVMVSNVTTLAEIGELLPQGRGLIERVITVTGTGVEKPGNYLMPVGTPLNFILAQVGLDGKAKEVIYGGPMMGKGVTFLETPITKGVSGILIATASEMAPDDRIYPCIKCAQCVNGCPIHLNPSMLGMLARKGDFEIMAEQYSLYDCFECGCCSYVCPSNIPLVQHFRIAKEVLRERRAAG